MAGLYIHVPFCVRKCGYCDFYSMPAAEDSPAMAAYLDALERELGRLPPDFSPQTVFIGGGTPTAMSAATLKRFLDLLAKTLDGRKVSEWTCEVNPGTLTPEKIDLLLKAGVNRLSIGMQSFDPEALRVLGRIHAPEQSEEAYNLIRSAGCCNVNIDLIYAVPGASTEVLKNDLRRIVELGPEHAAAYCLIFEEDTPITHRRDRGEVSEVVDETQLDQYNLIRQTLRDAGYAHYEISNFARPGFECRHNMLYWTGGEYIGCGPAAHSHWKDARYGNVKDLEVYVRAMREGTPAREFEERLKPEAKAREALVMGLRLVGGIARDEFLKNTGFDYMDLRGKEIAWLREEGLLVEKGGGIRLSEKGLFVSDSVFAELV